LRSVALKLIDDDEEEDDKAYDEAQ